MTDARARMRDIEAIMPTDLRGISSVAGDIYTMAPNELQFRAFSGASVLCSYVVGAATVIELPPNAMVVPDSARNAFGTVLTSWINAPVVGDQVFLYSDSTAAGNSDDSWTHFTITAVDSSTDFGPNSCLSTNAIPVIQAGDDASKRYRLTLSAAPSPLQILVGAPIRFAREVRYSGYEGADAKWYIGYQTCTPSGGSEPGSCGDREVLAGPVLPISTDTTTSGLFFVFYNQVGTRLMANRDTSLASISVGIRTTGESLRRGSSSSESIAAGDSLRFVIGIRNRI
jgi:hypothetical protein